jgi:hypothetical protein
MTPEQRLDRLERIAKLFVKAGFRQRTAAHEQIDKINILIDTQIQNAEHFAKTTQEQNEKINILIDAQTRTEDRYAARFAENEERFAKNEERFAKNEERFAKNEQRFAKTEQAIDRLIAAQARTDHKLQALIDAIRGKKPGESLA